MGESSNGCLCAARPPRRDENGKYEFRPCRNTPVEPGQWEAVTINHATVLIRLHGLNVLTTPVWSDRVSPVSWLSPKRQRPSGIPWEALLQIDAVLISHNHDDHVDATTLKRLEKRFLSSSSLPQGLPLPVLHCGARARIQEQDW